MSAPQRFLRDGLIVFLGLALVAGCIEDPRSYSSFSEPLPVPVTSKAERDYSLNIAVGSNHTCEAVVLKDASSIVNCWGDNERGQLGDGTRTIRATPAAVIGLTSVQSVTVGFFHSCALTGTGGVKCWGSNESGQLGDGTTIERLTPVDVVGLTSGVKALSAGAIHTCAIDSSDRVRCWGANGAGQLGNGGSTNLPSPTMVSVLGNDIDRIAAGYAHTCAVSQTGALSCWGFNDNGQLGDNSTTERRTPVAVSGLGSSVVDVAAARSHSCARMDGGSVRCWGSNAEGELGDGTSTPSLVPVVATSYAGTAVEVRAAEGSTCALDSGNHLDCWGKAVAAQPGQALRRGVPGAVFRIDLGELALHFTLGDRHACAVTFGEEPKCWGRNEYNQLGDGATVSYSNPGSRERTEGVGWSRPFTVAGLEQPSRMGEISAGLYQSCTTINGAGYCWGSNFYGELGNGLAATTAFNPSPVTGPGSNALAMYAGGGEYDPFNQGPAAHSCLIDDLEAAYCWGSNTEGQLGDGTQTNRPTPVAVAGLVSGVEMMALGYGHSCAVVNGGAYCWGYGANGQLGNGLLTSRLAPIAVSGLGSGVVGMVAGFGHSCALTNTGAVYCWGYNLAGEVGDGSFVNQPVPVAVSGLASGVKAIAAGGQFTCAINAANGVVCWGANNYGQLGNGGGASGGVPVAVSGLASGVGAVTGGGAHACATTLAGAMFCWGGGVAGQLGDGLNADHSVPTPVSGLDSGVASITGAFISTCAILDDGTGRCWGSNIGGVLGTGVSGNSGLPQTIVILRNTPPTVVYAADPSHPSTSSGPQTRPGFASITSGPAREAAQVVEFGVSTADPDQILVPGSVSISSAGELGYELTGATGAAVVAVTPRDDGGTVGGGSDRGETHEFRVSNGLGVDLQLKSFGYCAGVDDDAFGKFCQLMPGVELNGFSLAAEYRWDTENRGPVAVNGARFRAAISSGFQFRQANRAGGTGPAWTCSVPSGVCTPASGTGSIDTTFNLGVGQHATIALNGALDTTENFVEIHSSVTLPAGTPAFLAQDDRNTLIRPANAYGLFRGGFE